MADLSDSAFLECARLIDDTLRELRLHSDQDPAEQIAWLASCETEWEAEGLAASTGHSFADYVYGRASLPALALDLIAEGEGA